jgi:hypothetical protein
MTATLTFRLPGDQSAYVAATHGMEFFEVLSDLDAAMRNYLKYGTGPATFEELRKYLHDMLNERTLSLEMMQ